MLKNKVYDARFLTPLMIVITYVWIQLFNLSGIGVNAGMVYQMILVLYVFFLTFYKQIKPLQKLYLVLGILFCLIGDMALSRAFDTPNGYRLPIGMGLFFIGHVNFILGIFSFRKPKIKSFRTNFLIVFSVIVLLFVFTVFNPDELLLSILAIVYAVALGIGLTLGLSMKDNPIYRFLAWGYGIFIFSDWLIAIRAIKGWNTPDLINNQGVWLTYIVALSLICYSIVHLNRSINK
ncbi:lysoplasmalogenase [Acholeplasma manati]|uniref:Lysoplasmalogenase n=1 Tax=Paracholeplasma manati TaxID=591373 RepID=A0ABT2Y3V2_9MOLU|nr:lysoplasmalogenase [Paracholeplasma manati]MCV2231413.1 lysoplasmalogenase [Paracholeplasma manati]